MTDQIELNARIMKSLPVLFLVYDRQGNLKHIGPEILRGLQVGPTNEALENINVFLDKGYRFYKFGARTYLEKALKGKTSYIFDVPTAVEEVRELLGDASEEFIPEFSTACVFPIYTGTRVTEIGAMFYPQSRYCGNPQSLRCREWINEHWREQPDMQRMGQELNMSPDYLARVFKKSFGMTPVEYHRKLRHENVKKALADPNMTIKEAYLSCGISFTGSQAQLFKRLSGVTPGEYRRRAISEGLKKRAGF